MLFSGFYIWNVKWLNEDMLIVVYVNRKQNSAVTAIYDASSGFSMIVKVGALLLIVNSKFGGSLIWCFTALLSINLKGISVSSSIERR
jgi:hypothetical protein